MGHGSQDQTKGLGGAEFATRYVLGSTRHVLHHHVWAPGKVASSPNTKRGAHGFWDPIASELWSSRAFQKILRASIHRSNHGIYQDCWALAVCNLPFLSFVANKDVKSSVRCGCYVLNSSAPALWAVLGLHFIRF